MLSHQGPESVQDQPIEVKSLSTLDLYKSLPSDDEEDDFEYKQDDVELETGEDDEVEEEDLEKQEDVPEDEELEVPEEEVHDIVRVKEELYGRISETAEKRSFPGTYREPRFVDADLDEEDEDDEEYFDEEDVDETEEEDEFDEEEEVDYEDDDMVMEEEVNANIVNFGLTAGPQTAKNLLLKKGKVLRNKQLDPEPFEELLQARINSLLNPEA